MTSLPIEAVLPELLATLAVHPRAVLEAPPGAGKTTQVPPALLGAGWLAGRKVLMLEPRRIAARAAAEFMAAQRGEAVGATVGYRIRFESKVSAATRIEVVTEGILTRMIQDDPELATVGAILFDEFHERHLHGDLGAALALDVQATLRPDLRLLIMSATLDGERVARWFDAPQLVSEGRSFPVRIAHPPARAGEAFPERGWPFHLRRAVETALAENDGDVLVFLPGKREIERARAVLGNFEPLSPRERGWGEGPGEAQRLHDSEPSSGALRPLLPKGEGKIEIIPLHGELTLAEQHAALAPAAPGTRRVVLATNVAESSLTLPGVRAVVDSGLAREPRFDPNSGFTRLDTANISQASADQRAGRAGRLGPGACYRLWPQSRRLDAERTAEIAQVELSQLALELAAWGSDALRWLDPPPSGALAQARDLLRRLGALDAAGRLGALGRRMLTLGAQPRVATAVLRAQPPERALACDLAALIEARNPLRGEGGRNDDFRARVRALQAWRTRRAAGARELGADPGALAAIAQAADMWQRRAEPGRSGFSRDAAAVGRGNGIAAEAAPTTTGGMALAAGDLLIHAFPDRIAKQDANNPRRYTLANGRGARLADDSALYGEPWLVVIDLRQEARDSLVFAAAPFDPDRLERDFPERFARARSVRWNRDTRAVEAFEERRFDALVLERRAVPARPEDAVPALLAAVRELGLDALPWSDAARELRLRVEALRGWCPDLGLPDFSDAALLATLEDWLAPYLANKRRFDALQPAELSEALAARLDFNLRRTLDEQAPVAIRVPSGLERRIAYAADAPPVLAVKLQELFGLADTPRIAGGRVPLTLHLLSPGGKPVQVTQDLRSFWERTYPEVKKELKGRYPKHPWPDDPWTATPTHRAAALRSISQGGTQRRRRESHRGASVGLAGRGLRVPPYAPHFRQRPRIARDGTLRDHRGRKGPPRRGSSMSNPRRVLPWMGAFLVAVGLLGALLAPRLAAIFAANPFFNGIILTVLAAGIVVNLRQVLVLAQDADWIESFRRSNPAQRPPGRPRLLAPMARMLDGRDRGRAALSAPSMRTILDSVQLRLEESRDLSRYLTGLAIFLGLLGTFWGLLVTIRSVADIIGTLNVGNDAVAMFGALKENLKEPLGGMSTSFSTSLFGLASSLVIGFLDLQAGHAQNRFYNELEEWLSGMTRLSSGSALETDASVPAYVQALLEQTADGLDRMQRAIVEAERERHGTNQQLGELGAQLGRLADLLGRDARERQASADVQDELKNVLRQLASQGQPAATLSDDLRAELRLLSRTIAAALDGQRPRVAAPMVAERESR